MVAIIFRKENTMKTFKIIKDLHWTVDNIYMALELILNPNGKIRIVCYYILSDVIFDYFNLTETF